MKVEFPGRPAFVSLGSLSPGWTFIMEGKVHIKTDIADLEGEIMAVEFESGTGIYWPLDLLVIPAAFKVVPDTEGGR